MFICNVSEINYLHSHSISLKVFKFSHPGPKNKCNDKFICKWIKLRSRKREYRDRNRLSQKKIQVPQN